MNRALAVAVSVALAVSVVSSSGGGTATARQEKARSPSPPVAALMQDWGVSQAEAEARIERQDQVSQFAEFLAANHPLDYGGMWIDHPAGGIVVVAVLTPGIATEAAPKFGLADIVKEVSATRTWIELEAITTAIGEAIVARGLAVDTVIDVQGNQVAVTIPEDSTPVQRDFAEEARGLYGVAVEIRTGPLRGWFDDACTDTACDPPIRGGLKVVGSGNCSTGFVMQNIGGAKRILTAAHCSPGTGSKFRHNGIVIGGTINSQDSGKVDARTIGFDSVGFWNPKRWVFHQTFASFPADPSFTITSRVTNAGIVLYTYICRTGFNSNTRCGSIEYLGASFGNNTNVPLVFACAIGGDSGGPYYDFDGHKAYGTHIGSTYDGSCPDPNFPNEYSAFSPIQSIENALNVTVFTGA